MSERFLLDTGPLVALINRNDAFHDWAKREFDQIVPPLFTCEGVLTEACHLLRRTGRSAYGPLEMIDRGVLIVRFQINEDAAAVTDLMDRYANVPMSYADACLVRMSEQYERCTVLTLDGDFRIYRRHGRRRIPLRIPDDR